MKLRTVHPNELEWLKQAVQHIRRAQTLLRHARAKKAHRKVAGVRKSVEGALRHAERASWKVHPCKLGLGKTCAAGEHPGCAR